ncbi:hypothetical protein F5I97DRAFT_4474 [Phlebopus sp. FC_14]|nr:hypothetical protein F5I97DRAFT_4474 [Phlebopus sp. FC_14]
MNPRFFPELDRRSCHAAMAEHSVPFNTNQLHLNERRLAENGSPSGSDEDPAGYQVYSSVHKMDTEGEDDPNASLTSQTLNADGTPKRPMNAFMIFARRRRPQVSAENQSMRTGEVSKILSREWNAMELCEKQFYLDQAKLLKDNFNQKYPDYVYRRRPNNSRKRRKADGGNNFSSDQQNVADAAEDYSASSAEYGDISPVDMTDNDSSRYGGGNHDVRYPNPSGDSTGNPYPDAPSRAGSYSSSDVSPYRSLGDKRGSYVSSTSRGLDHSAPHYHPYLPPHHHAPSSSSSYYSEPDSTGETWTSAVRDDQSRLQMPSWPQGGQDQSSVAAGEDAQRAYTSQAPTSHGWVGATASDSMTSSGTSGVPTFGFPTLNSPFYPGPSDGQDGFPSSTGPAVTVPPQNYSTVTPVQGSALQGRSNTTFEGRGYSSHASVQPSYSVSSMTSYPQQPRNAALGLANSSGPPLSGYSQVGPATISAGPGVANASQMRYWMREKVDH